MQSPDPSRIKKHQPFLQTFFPVNGPHNLSFGRAKVNKILYPRQQTNVCAMSDPDNQVDNLKTVYNLLEVFAMFDFCV